MPKQQVPLQISPKDNSLAEKIVNLVKEGTVTQSPTVTISQNILTVLAWMSAD